MTPLLTSMPASKKKVYRFALYGRRNSGKTCILASLAMERVAHPDGLSCTWLDTPPKGSRPTGEAGYGNEDDVTAAFTHGKAWLEQAIRNLEQGAVPPPNPHDKDAFRFMYEFTAGDHRTFLVELIDYSGELIDPDLSDTDLAKRLRQHMLTMDGILVLAEAPCWGQQAGELYKELQRLKRAFAALRGEKQDGPALAVPVALLINKWDRRTQTDGFSSRKRPSEIDEFLASQPEPPHRGLVDTLQGSVVQGLFKAFPVSAFGKHATNGEVNGTENGQKHPERPAQVNPLCSFGLEDGFVWACRCRDQIDVSELESEARNRAWWKPWQLVDRKVRRSLKERASQLGQRFPQSSEEHRRVRAAARRSATALTGQFGLAAMMLAILYLGAGAINDYLSYRAHRPTFANLQAAEKNHLNEAEKWLEQYGNNKWLFHAGFRPFFSGESAAAQLVSIREWKRDSALVEWSERWKEIERAPDEVTKEGLAKKLRDDLRGATYSDENVIAKCNSLLELCEANRKIRDNVTALQTVEAEFGSLVSGKSEVKEEYRRVRRRVEDLPIHKDSETKELAEQRVGLLRKIDNRLEDIERLDVDRKNSENSAFISEQARRLKAGGEVTDFELILAAVKRGLPHPDVASDQIQQRYSALRLEAQGKLDDSIRRRDWLKFEDEYHALMRRGSLREAAQRLVDKGMDFSEIAALKADFCKKCLPQLEDKKSELVRGKQWDRARETLKTVRTDKYAKSLLADEQLRRIEDIEHEVNISEDKHLYAQVENHKTRTAETIQKYLADAPLKTMKRKVEDYRDYLTKMDGKIEFEIEGTVLWGANCWENYKNSVKISVDGSELFDAEATSNQNGNADLGGKSCTRKLSDKINVNVTVKVTNGTFIFSSREHGQGTFEGKVNDLQGGGKTIELDKYGNRVVLKIKESTLPKQPTLPEWRE
jgi:hypothetical protein